MSILFINGSPNKKGNTAKLAAKLLEGWMLEKAEYTMSRFARMYGMEYVGMAASAREAEKLAEKI